MRPLVLAALGLVLSADAGRAVTDEQRAEICVEAEQRYRQIFGKPSSDSDVPVITMYKHTFCPSRLTVKAGQTLRWINVDRRTSHSVWFRDAGQAESERVFGEEKIEMKIDLPKGEHQYICGPHWKDDGMVAVIVVE